MNHTDSCCNVMLGDVDEGTIAADLSAIRDAKAHICELAGKYGTSQETLSLRRVINAKRTKMWEVLNDSRSGKVRGYGAFPRKYADEYDEDIRKLLEIINKINS